MSTYAPITVGEGNDEVVELTVDRQEPGDDLTTVAALEFVMKDDTCTADGDASLVLSSTVPAQMVILTQTAAQITAEAFIPAAFLAEPYTRTYRLDGLSTSGTRRTALHGPIYVEDL
jgi:hypothetical protein